MRLHASPFVALVVLALPAAAQQEFRAGLRPITAPVQYAGVYHLGTGSWTRAGPGAPNAMTATGVGVVFDNTCDAGYTIALPLGARVFDEGRLPSPTSPVLPNSFGLGHDSEVGTQASYTIDGFQISYCTDIVSPQGYQVSFYDAYSSCSGGGLGIPTASFALTGLPVAPTAGVVQCWTVDIDLCASSQSFTLTADANGIYDGPPGSMNDTFGWSFSPMLSTSTSSGWKVAGGRMVSGSYQSCSASDGTIFDSGSASPFYPANSDAINLGCGSLSAGAAPEEGSGMGTLDQFRIENSGGVADGCYWFGGIIPGNFHLQLYSANVSLPNTPLSTDCTPGQAGTITCPCGNPPAGTTRGCDNSAATGGASLLAIGTASVASDTLVFSTAGQVPLSTTMIVQGTSSNPAGFVFGQGVRCVGGTRRILYLRASNDGRVTVPGPGDASVSARSAALGDPLQPGAQRFYFACYRDTNVLGGCSSSATFNCTNGGSVTWN